MFQCVQNVLEFSNLTSCSLVKAYQSPSINSCKVIRWRCGVILEVWCNDGSVVWCNDGGVVWCNDGGVVWCNDGGVV